MLFIFLLRLSRNLVAAAAEVAFVADAEFVAANLNDKLNKSVSHSLIE